MTQLKIDNGYVPLAPQEAYRRSTAFIRGYGGAMGGGKSRAMCEEALDLALDHPGIPIVMCRLRHNSITETTKKTMLDYVLPHELIAKQKESGGEDYVKLHNGSTIHFIGLDDPVKWFSSELGALFFDEAHELPEESVTKLITRLRHPAAPITMWNGEPQPGKVSLAFNPHNPGHWLYQWFLVGSETTEHGTYKDALYPTDAEEPIGSAEFIFASPRDNSYLPAGYLRSLMGQADHLKRRYLDGAWEFIGGKCYFDVDALERYRAIVPKPLYRFDFEPVGQGFQARRNRTENGKWRIYEEPIEGLSYAIGADVASGRGKDFSAAYVIRLDEPKIVAEYHAKIDPDLYAEQLHFGGRWYNTALIAVETQGGYGDAVVIPLRDGRGARPAYPKLYRHVLSTRPDLPTAKPFGFPMSTHTRPLVISQIEKTIREEVLPYLPERLLNESLTFAEAETLPSPRALDGCNDDCVMAAAIALEMYRLRGHHPDRDERRKRRARKRGIKRRLTRYPWERAVEA